MNQSVSEKPKNEENTHHITQADLPLSCPMKGSETWNTHPRVYLDINQSGVAQCSYCGARYILDQA